MRIDKYLKISRLIKRRTVAHDACEQERVFLNDKPAKPGAEVKPGDEILICFGNSRLHVRVTSIPEHVSKEKAPSLYEIITE
jgi:ribosomal 50S subunit-recycling heat shock protein